MNVLDPVSIIQTAGLIGIFLIIFAESGLLFGFFFPGDTLLFAAGIFASRGFLSISLLIIGCVIASILGDSIGYWLGKRIGRRIFEFADSIFFSKKRLVYAENFYRKHGPLTVIIARFVPMARTLAPVVAGIAKMDYKKFLLYNIVGGILWAAGLPLVGYYFGSLIPNIDRFLLPILIVVMIISFIPLVARFAYYFFARKGR